MGLLKKNNIFWPVDCAFIIFLNLATALRNFPYFQGDRTKDKEVESQKTF